MSDNLVTVLGVGRYSFNDEKTNRLVEGTTVHYYSHEEKQSNDDSLGFKPVKATLPYDYYEKFKDKSFPYDAEIDFSLTIKSGKPAIKVNGFTVV